MKKYTKQELNSLGQVVGSLCMNLGTAIEQQRWDVVESVRRQLNEIGTNISKRDMELSDTPIWYTSPVSLAEAKERIDMLQALASAGKE